MARAVIGRVGTRLVFRVEFILVPMKPQLPLPAHGGRKGAACKEQNAFRSVGSQGKLKNETQYTLQAAKPHRPAKAAPGALFEGKPPSSVAARRTGGFHCIS
jgi:hypothetical protein